MRFSPVTMVVAAVIGLGAGLGIAAAVSGGNDSSSKSSGSFADIARMVAKIAAKQVQVALANDGKGGMNVKITGAEQFAPDPQSLIYSPNGARAVPDLPTQNVVAVGAGNVVGVGAGGVVSVGAGNVVGVGAGNVIAVGAGNLLSEAGGTLKAPPNSVVGVGAGNIIAIGAGSLNVPMSKYQASPDDVLPITQQGCTDPWLSKAIDDRTHTGTPPDGGNEAMCSPQLIGLSPGQYFVNKDQYKTSVDAFFNSKCPDIWVTRAIMEVTNRQPNGPECEIWRYNNGHWNSYPELKKYVAQAGLYTRPRSSG